MMANFADMSIRVLSGHRVSVDTHALDTHHGDYDNSQVVSLDDAPDVICGVVERCRAITNHMAITVNTRYPLTQEMQQALINATSRGQVTTMVVYHNETHIEIP
jgi:hypothetical protein